ncbi:MAG: hypothetical protein IPG85_04340 [Bacteroidetes bacterium]|nr:hypothetical protein [Bacteroidota bacterium]
MEEYEEKNKHTFDNIEGTGHVVGVYRWLNLEYKCKLMNYGRRLTFEFSVPEPAAFHIYAKRFTASDIILLENPIHPRDGVNIPGLGLVYLNSANNLDETNFLAWASVYDAKVEPYPANKSVSKGYFKNSDSWASVADNDFAIPEGYYAKDGSITCDKESFSVSIRVDTQGLWFNGPIWFTAFSFPPTVKLEGTIAVSTVGKARYFANVTLNCEPTTETIKKWKIETYNAIMDAYAIKKRAYDDALQQVSVQKELQLSGTNPALYRQIEMKELKKGCIQLLNAGFYNLITGYNNFYHQFYAMKYKDDAGYPPAPANPFDYPEFDNCQAIAEGHILSFFEKVFDWDIMSYKFFPYFWGQKKRWKMLYNLQDNDALFSNFLQAGHAKVLIPVKPGYEAAAIQFLETGQLWNDGAIAGADAGNLSALQMIDDFYGAALNDGEPIMEHEWATSVPTNLVVLQCETGCVSGGPGLPENADN